MKRLMMLGLTVVACASPAAAQNVYISELMVGNDGNVCDSLGHDPDWVELHNPTSAPIDLSGWSLTDRPVMMPQRWSFPPGTVIVPREYKVVFFQPKGEGIDVSNAKELHAGFRLDVKGEDISLLNAKGVEVHRVRFGKQLRDVSIGTSDRYEPVVQLSYPTPGLPNNAPKPTSNNCQAGRK
jgi:hypothetical protein